MSPRRPDGPDGGSRLRFLSAGVRVDLVGVDGPLAHVVRSVGAGMLTDEDGPADRSLTVTRDADGSLVLDMSPPGGMSAERARLAAEPEVAAAGIVSALDRVALLETACLALHAAAVAGPRGAAVIPGRSGSGKSTLAAACLQAGLRLLSDEAACLDPEADVLWSHPRPLGLSAASRELLGLPEARSAADQPDELAVSPAVLGRSVPGRDPNPVALVVLAVRRPGAVAALSSATRAEGLALLLGHGLNVGAGRTWGTAAAWHRLAALARRTDVARLTYDDPRDGAGVLGQALSG